RCSPHPTLPRNTGGGKLSLPGGSRRARWMANAFKSQPLYHRGHMLILLTNDDGIRAPGLAAMYRELVQLGEVHVVAPETVQSATGHGVTLSTPLLTDRVTVEETFTGISVDGRPADCVKLAVAELLPRPPDLVISGINSGANVGINIIYSGTIA